MGQSIARVRGRYRDGGTDHCQGEREIEGWWDRSLPGREGDRGMVGQIIARVRGR